MDSFDGIGLPFRVKLFSLGLFRILCASLAIRVATVAMLMVLTGCSHYQLGTQGKLTFTTLYVEPIDDAAGVPQATALVTTQIREAFLHDGRVTLAATPEQADATLGVKLTHYGRTVTTVLPGDTGLARKFDLTLNAVCSLRDNRAGNYLFEKRLVEAVRQIFTTDRPPLNSSMPIESNQLQAEYQTLPLLAQLLASKISHATLDVW